MIKSPLKALIDYENKNNKIMMDAVGKVQTGINLMDEGLNLQVASIGNTFITEIVVDIKLPNKTVTTTMEIYGEWGNGYRGNREEPPEPKGWIINSIKLFGVEVGLDSKLHQAVKDYVRDME